MIEGTSDQKSVPVVQNSNLVDSIPQDEFDMKERIYSYRFYLMCKLRFKNQETFDKSHDMFLKITRDTLAKYYTNNSYIEKIISKIVTNAYNTIPGEFWGLIDKKLAVHEQSKPLPFPRISKVGTPDPMIDYNHYSKKNKKKKK